MKPTSVVICLGSSCFSRGNARNVEIAEKYLAAHGLRDEVDIDLSGGLCAGCCAEGPIVSIGGRNYTRVDGDVMLDLLKEYFS